MRQMKALKTLTIVLFGFGLVLGIGSFGLAEMDDDMDEIKTMVTASGEGLWIYPGVRKLNPEVFGTPENPKMLEALPRDQRKVSEDGKKFTTTKQPGPFSNKVAPSERELSLTIWIRLHLTARNQRTELSWKLLLQTLREKIPTGWN